MSIGLTFGPLPKAAEGLKLLFPLVCDWLEVESDAQRGFRDPAMAAHLIEEMLSRLLASVSGERYGGVYMDRGRFGEEIGRVLRSGGYRRPDGVGRYSVRSLKSRHRVDLIWDMCNAQSVGYSKWVTGVDVLENEPCHELLQVVQCRERRDWRTVWSEAGGLFFMGRMVARKCDPIWCRISSFGTPWDPFDWGSGMRLRGVDIDEAESLGAIGADDPPLPPEIKFNLSSRLRDGDSFQAVADWLDLDPAYAPPAPRQGSVKQLPPKPWSGGG